MAGLVTCSSPMSMAGSSSAPRSPCVCLVFLSYVAVRDFCNFLVIVGQAGCFFSWLFVILRHM